MGEKVFLCGRNGNRVRVWLRHYALLAMGGGGKRFQRKKPPQQLNQSFSPRAHTRKALKPTGPLGAVYFIFFRFYLFVPDTETGIMISGWLVGGGDNASLRGRAKSSSFFLGNERGHLVETRSGLDVYRARRRLNGSFCF
jgi:hypothetical protein